MNHPVSTPAQIRAVLPALRKHLGLTQAQLGALIGVSQKRIARIEAAWTRKGQRVVDDVVAAAAKQDVHAQGVLAHADQVAQAVIAAARKHKCDLIVMASHGRRGLTRVLLGSETQHVLTHSTIPVLVLR